MSQLEEFVILLKSVGWKHLTRNFTKGRDFHEELKMSSKRVAFIKADTKLGRSVTKREANIASYQQSFNYNEIVIKV